MAADRNSLFCHESTLVRRTVFIKHGSGLDIISNNIAKERDRRKGLDTTYFHRVSMGGIYGQIENDEDLSGI